MTCRFPRRCTPTSPCRDARSVRPSPLKVTASSWFDNGRSDRASLQGVVSACPQYPSSILSNFVTFVVTIEASKKMSALLSTKLLYLIYYTDYVTTDTR